MTIPTSPSYRREEHGFTLIELLVVVVIIGILIAIAIPLYLNYENGAKNKSAQSDVRGAVSTTQQCLTDGDVTVPTSASNNGAAGTTITLTCGTQTRSINTSNGNTLYVTAVSTGGNHFVIAGQNASGAKTYCYDSSAGGSVKQTTSAFGALTAC